MEAASNASADLPAFPELRITAPCRESNKALVLWRISHLTIGHKPPLVVGSTAVCPRSWAYSHSNLLFSKSLGELAAVFLHEYTQHNSNSFMRVVAGNRRYDPVSILVRRLHNRLKQQVALDLARQFVVDA